MRSEGPWPILHRRNVIMQDATPIRVSVALRILDHLERSACAQGNVGQVTRFPYISLHFNVGQSTRIPNISLHFLDCSLE